jgi:hypothetical protein
LEELNMQITKKILLVLSIGLGLGLVGIFFIILLSSKTYADSSKIQNPNNGHQYQRFDTKMTWIDAYAYCESVGGYLATITSQDENDFVYSNFGIDGISIWLGGTDEESEGVWQWITGESWSYTNWSSGAPDDAYEGQDYLWFSDSRFGKWDDGGPPHASDNSFFICEWSYDLITLTISESATEGDGILTGQGKVSVAADLSTDLVINLSSSDTSEITLPETVTIYADQNSATFDITVIDDDILDGSQAVTIAASAPDYISGIASIQVKDDDKIQNHNTVHLYQRFDIEMTWNNACAYCESLGGHLATITSQNEDDFVYSNLGIDGISIWLGGTDETTEGTWKWITGESWSYTNWGSFQPDDIANGQDYLIYFSHEPGKWDDAGLPNEDFNFPFICEWSYDLIILTIPESATEGDGILTGQGKVSVAADLSTDLVINLSSSDTSEITLPETVTIYADQNSATFDITVIDDTLFDGSQTVIITAFASGYISGIASIHVRDNDINLAEGLVAYYPFNGNANDFSGNGNHGTVYGVTLCGDRFGNPNSAYCFDGLDDYIEALDEPSLDVNMFTLAAWIYLEAIGENNEGGIIWKENYDGKERSYAILVRKDSGTPIIRFLRSKSGLNWMGGLLDTSGSYPIPYNEWCHVVGTYDGSSMKVYKDGQVIGQIESSGITYESTATLKIGDLDPGYLPRPFNGLIDNVRIYDRALSELEIQELYNEKRITLTIPGSATEGDGILTGQGKVSVSADLSTDLVVSLSSNDTSLVNVPETVTIYVDQNTATFDINILNNCIFIGSQTITITASASGYISGLDSIKVAERDLSIEMTVPSGWSMISLPVIPCNTSVSSVFPNAKVVYSYEKDFGYDLIKGDENIKIGKGYWILLDQNQHYTFTGERVFGYNKKVYEDGWEMIGGCISGAQPTADNCDIVVIYRYVQGIGYQRVLDSEKLEACGGFWILFSNVTDQAQLNVSFSDIIFPIPIPIQVPEII